MRDWVGIFLQIIAITPRYKVYKKTTAVLGQITVTYQCHINLKMKPSAAVLLAVFLLSALVLQSDAFCSMFQLLQKSGITNNFSLQLKSLGKHVEAHATIAYVAIPANSKIRKEHHYHYNQHLFLQLYLPLYLQ